MWLFALSSVLLTYQANDVDDEKLVAAVAKAVKDRVAPNEIEKFVGRRATIDMSIPDQINAFKLARLSPDPKEKKPLPSFENYKRTIYWVRPIESNAPRIIGIVWREDSVEVFYAIGGRP